MAVAVTGRWASRDPRARNLGDTQTGCPHAWRWALPFFRRPTITPDEVAELERFLCHVRSVNGHKECWVWWGSMRKDGRPLFGHIYTSPPRESAAAFSWRTFVGAVPHGMRPEPTCGCADCVNPLHLHLEECPR